MMTVETSQRRIANDKGKDSYTTNMTKTRNKVDELK